MARTYTTVQGDAWDYIAYKIWGDEKYMKQLIEANWRHLDVLVFPSGVVLNVPDLTEEMQEEKPFWRDDEADASDVGLNYYEYESEPADEVDIEDLIETEDDDEED